MAVMNDDDGPVSAEMTVLGADSACSYLPDQLSRFEHRWIWSLSSQQYEALLSRGWRRFGRALFRPTCRTCRECRSLRVVLADAQATKSQRRCRNRNSDIRIIVQSPTVTEEHVALYNAYHSDMHQRRGWPLQTTTCDDYYGFFVDGEFEFSREFLYLQGDRLIGIGLVDMTDRVQSSLYFVHHPEWRDRSPGTFSVLSEIEAGQAAGREYLYLGYYIRDCRSMNYKNRFRPHEFLQSNVSDAETPVWALPKPDEQD
jgi:leucyl-tRNA---protein transferase